MQATRQQILDHLRASRHATVRELGRVLGLTATGIRQHLTVLEQEGLVVSDEIRGQVGRPALRYRLTEEGEAVYPKRYPELALALLDELREQVDAVTFQQTIRGAASRLAGELRSDMPSQALPEERVEAAVRMLRAEHIVCDWERAGEGWLLHQRTCPYPEVARQNSAMCAMDVALIRELCGMDVVLTACTGRGDENCAYHLTTTGAS